MVALLKTLIRNLLHKNSNTKKNSILITEIQTSQRHKEIVQFSLEKTVVTYQKKQLTPIENSVLAKGLNFLNV